ncbi:C40 family peptidase [Cohnella zeiphila]|uniref:C40 family peptidase n=1 Tax=Cohnella zeiphila TaxID=2761120 RepID=A0A7X0SP34_9BACL|nr:C40 family peptidase [Cohnella zeiphila]MBB6733501.1 C40 family peptidase [Cohnella zeiphila]
MGHQAFLVRTVAAAAAVALAVSLAGCVRNPGDTRGDLSKYSAPVKIKSKSETMLEERGASSSVPIVQIHRSDYVAAGDVARAIGLHGQWLKDGAYGIGSEDPEWTFRTGESEVRLGAKAERMPAPAVKMSNRLYIPAAALSALFGRVATFGHEGSRIAFYPQPAKVRSEAAKLPFSDAKQNGNIRSLSAGGSKYDSLIDDAKKFLGVRYDFGTGNYADTGTFDCSSFVQYLFGHYGVNLPRTAREQGQEGTAVSRDSLQTGDLLFFSVPGRFKSDSTPGHVGIYMGNGSMIHSSPQPNDGVQISDINSSYWQDHFLFAKRIPLP